jgi:hypothetical protein
MPTYFDASITGNVKFDAWCVTPDTQIVYGATYTALVLSPADVRLRIESAEPGPCSLDHQPGVCGKAFTGGGDFTMGDVQNAIWLLVDDSLSVDQGPSYPARVQEIINAPLLNGEGYQPACGVRDILVVVPVAEGCDLNTTSTTLDSQVIIIEVPVPCGPGTGTPGYWINHPAAWPVELIEIGGFIYSKEQAIARIGLPPFQLQVPVVRNCWRIWLSSMPDEEAVICR